MFAPTTDQPIETVDKESIPTLRFSQEDVLTDQAALERRSADAERASRLGNAYHGKLDIFFQTADGQPKRVQTAVWGAHPEYLTLKAGIMLPLRAVLGFDFY
ncbi:hypothetical protein [Hymenobacter sp. BT559]|jgi:hypothetical protein|uniref:hypothetical protein n=1 Tax=Hymenobacter sp. BT559 TaxID=2795729 RepID=UPI0018EE1BF7|nr:hypothetical protein [Hymenobacter sp. BT559]MBJ6145923.1 hypothetical protein [Hymenobacter sp. BT559]